MKSPAHLGRKAGAGAAIETSDAESLSHSHVETQPQFRNRRAFVVWAVRHGFAPPERLTERILAEIQEGDQCPFE